MSMSVMMMVLATLSLVYAGWKKVTMFYFVAAGFFIQSLLILFFSKMTMRQPCTAPRTSSGSAELREGTVVSLSIAGRGSAGGLGAGGGGDGGSDVDGKDGGGGSGDCGVDTDSSYGDHQRSVSSINMSMSSTWV
jgi:hypothetical protein